MRSGILGGQLYCPLEVGDGFIVLPFCVESSPQVVERIGILWLDLQRLPEEVYCDTIFIVFEMFESCLLSSTAFCSGTGVG